MPGLLFSPVPTLWSFYWFHTPFVMRMSLEKYPQQEVCSQSRRQFVWLEERLFCTRFLHILQNSLLTKHQNNCASLFISYIRATYLHEIKEKMVWWVRRFDFTFSSTILFLISWGKRNFIKLSLLVYKKGILMRQSL